MSDDPKVYERLAALERKVDHMYRHLTGAEGGPAAVPPLPAVDQSISPRVRELVSQGNTIEAIKLYRAETGVDLAVAKARIDELMD
jgi:ribosomal protein L7/L12